MNTDALEKPSESRKIQMQNSVIAELHSDQDWLAAATVLRVLRPQLDIDSFVKDRARLTSEGYRLIGIKVNDEVVAIASYIITPHSSYFRELQIHDMATLEEHQSMGYGSKLLTEIDRIASEQQCGRCFVQSRAERHSAHEFYRKNGYQDYSLGFIKKVG
ncbi:MAG TPA: GNAT family N-acetyltransferase [Oligoflexia bacterium]|nr:GNAT family N-acetyltransferase [Oligoflexia bacterium]HMP27035.1 GNAT family N-acetyltransferase [Oligoflexia bacterium]